ncbi:MAG: polysaccharide deacetylase family protein, partial [Marinobacter sp.]|uniref:polysaccharide deacetylase family protein n=1 Tax=Marinobacter sp. TaxID=50741 RepID=UPI00299F3AA0
MTPTRLLFSALALAGLVSAGPAHADLVVLQYHHVSPSTPASTSTTPSLFRAQMQMIRDLGLEVVPLQEGTEAALAGELTDRQQVAITFDDAYESVWTTAAPILEEFGYPFTVFVNTNAVGKGDVMTWDQLAQWAEAPQVLIANHSHDHGHLPQKPGESDQAWRERINVSLDRAQSILQEKLGTRPPLFAYPYGEFGDKLEQAIADRDWYGYGQQSGPIGASSSPTRLPRFPMATAYGQLDSLENKLRSQALPVSANQLPSGVMRENPPALELALPDQLDPGRLNCFASGQGRINVIQQAGQQVRIQADNRFQSRRFRYNCTYPIQGGRFYWLSH